MLSSQNENAYKEKLNLKDTEISHLADQLQELEAENRLLHSELGDHKHEMDEQIRASQNLVDEMTAEKDDLKEQYRRENKEMQEKTQKVIQEAELKLQVEIERVRVDKLQEIQDLKENVEDLRTQKNKMMDDNLR